MISILCATRGRPNNMRLLYKSATQTAVNPIEFVWFIDDDDAESIKMAEELNTTYLTLPRRSITLSEAYNRCSELASYDIIYCVGDDVVFHTPKWDLIVTEAFNKYEDKILLCGGYDGLNNNLITHPIVHRRWIEVLGHLQPTYFRDCYVDTWMNEIAKAVGRLMWLPIFVEHRHFTAGHQYDQTAQERMNLINQNDESGQIFMRTQKERIEEANKLYEYIHSCAKQPS